MALIRVSTNALETARIVHGLSESIARRIIGRSLNRTIVGVRTDASKRAREELNLKAKRINRDLKVRRARTGSSFAELQIAASQTPLIEFAARATQRGVSVKVKKRGKRERLRHAFIARMPSGHVGVFERRIEGGKPVGRLQIDELKSTHLVQFFNDDGVIQPIAARARERFARELGQDIAHAVRKKGGVA